MKAGMTAAGVSDIGEISANISQPVGNTMRVKRLAVRALFFGNQNPFPELPPQPKAG
jgi:hypothetical protein